MFFFVINILHYKFINFDTKKITFKFEKIINPKIKCKTAKKRTSNG